MADRFAVITGSGTGIGRSSALALMNDGWSVALCGRRKEMLEETASMKKAGRALVIPTDVTDPEQVEKLFATVKAEFGRIDMLSNYAFKIMRDQSPRGGRIINNGSISAHVPRVGSVAYTATKHAITGLTKSIALDGREYDICSCQIDI